MSNSETPASFEEKWTAYVDGRLSPDQAAAFERENPGVAEERVAADRIAGSLREHLTAPAMKNADFFNESILREIAPARRNAGVAAPETGSFWTLWRMVAAGACCLLAAGAVYLTFVAGQTDSADRYVAKVLSAKAGDGELYATVLDADGLAVVWIDGFDQLSEDYVLE